MRGCVVRYTAYVDTADKMTLTIYLTASFGRPIPSGMRIFVLIFHGLGYTVSLLDSDWMTMMSCD